MIAAIVIRQCASSRERDLGARPPRSFGLRMEIEPDAVEPAEFVQLQAALAFARQQLRPVKRL